MQNKLLILGLFIFLSGCATKEPTINTVIQKVEIPIAVPCKVETPVRPEFNFDKLSVDQDLFEKTRALLADIKLHIAYETELRAALKSCQ
jgi:hypothetical protein